MRNLRTILLSIATLGLAATAGAASAQPTLNLVVNDNDAPAAQLQTGVYDEAQPAGLEQADFFWGGRTYCWYDGGWRGPGWYWCGFAWRRGYGWGGPVGWHGWVWRGHGGWHDGGHWGHGGGHWGGGGHWDGHGGGHDGGHGGHDGGHDGGHGGHDGGHGGHHH